MCGAITSTVRWRPISRNSASSVASNWRMAEPNWKPCVHSVQPRLVYRPPTVKTGAPLAGAQDFSMERILAADRANIRRTLGSSALSRGADFVSTIPRNSSLLPLEPQAGAAQIDLVAGTQFLAPPIAGGDFDGAAVAEHAGAEFAAVVAQAVVARLQPYVRVLAADGGVALVGAFFEYHVVAPYHAMVGVGQLGHAADIGPHPFHRVLRARGLPLDQDHAPDGGGRGRRRGLRGFRRVLDLKGAQSGFGGTHFHGKTARQLALAARQPRANVRFEALAERRLQDGAALRFSGHQRHHHAREREDAASASDNLHLAFHLRQNGAMEQQQLAGFGRAEHALSE